MTTGCYPRVKGEFDTMRLVAKGYNLARFGDGEFKMACGEGYRREPGSPALAAELTGILMNPAANCLVGIPTMDDKGPKFPNWDRHRARFIKMLYPHRRFHSSFISRPDSAPWINTREYAELVQSLWAGKKATVLCEPTNSILPLIRKTASEVFWQSCPPRECYKDIEKYEDILLAFGADITIMSCGPTATCLANRLALFNTHAVDIGSAGGFLGKLLK